MGSAGRAVTGSAVVVTFGCTTASPTRMVLCRTVPAFGEPRRRQEWAAPLSPRRERHPGPAEPPLLSAWGARPPPPRPPHSQTRAPHFPPPHQVWHSLTLVMRAYHLPNPEQTP